MNWISVEDRLPGADEWVIYHAPNIFGPESPQMWIGQYDNGVFFGRQGFFGGGEVTHWMPLPELPGEVK